MWEQGPRGLDPWLDDSIVLDELRAILEKNIAHSRHSRRTHQYCVETFFRTCLSFSRPQYLPLHSSFDTGVSPSWSRRALGDIQVATHNDHHGCDRSTCKTGHLVGCSPIGVARDEILHPKSFSPMGFTHVTIEGQVWNRFVLTFLVSSSQSTIMT